MMADSRVKDFFKNVDMTKQEQKQKDFLTMVLNGPNK
jgi:truncated hemoglobin YjbI